MKNGTFIAAFVVLLISGGIAAQDADVAPDVEIDETAGQFPRVWTNDAGSVIVHAPEIEAWPDFAIVLARAAIEVTLNEESAPTLGTIQFTASTETNLDLRLIALDDIVLTEIGFSGSLTAERNAQLEEFVTATLPLAPTEVPVEVVLSYISSDTTLPTIEGLQMEPPPIFYSSTPAVLVQTDGDPLFAPIEDTRLEFIVNTNWDLFHYRDREWYLLNEEHWLTSDELTGPWEYDRRLPNDFDDLPADGNFSSARRAIPAERTDEDAPNVFYSDRPAELIVIAGAETRVPIGGPGLGYVSNTSSDLFVHLDQYYFLASGRWFTADQLRGPWTQAPTLPEAFASIPADHPDKGRIRASVPGTDEARLAALEALIPRRAVVSRDAGANVIVNYYGEPEFEVIFGTTVSRAVNSPNDVLLADGRYYLCLNAVWYASSVPDGPWAVADTIPTAVYTIPASSPVYHVTNVHVYESDEDTVSTGFTGGYTGLYVPTVSRFTAPVGTTPPIITTTRSILIRITTRIPIATAQRRGTTRIRACTDDPVRFTDPMADTAGGLRTIPKQAPLRAARPSGTTTKLLDQPMDTTRAQGQELLRIGMQPNTAVGARRSLRMMIAGSIPKASGPKTRAQRNSRDQAARLEKSGQKFEVTC